MHFEDMPSTQHVSVPAVHVAAPHAIPFVVETAPSAIDASIVPPPSVLDTTVPPQATSANAKRAFFAEVRTIGEVDTIPDVRTLRKDEHGDGARLLAAAFDDDPMFEWMLRASSRRKRWITWIMRTMIDVCDPIFAWDSEGVLGGVLATVPPGGWPPPFFRSAGAYVSAGLFPWPTRRLIVDGLVRIQGAMNRTHPKAPHWYIAVLGVEPRLQGKGAGRELLSHALSRADEDGVPAYLETTRPKNLAYYRGFGFEIVEEMKFPNDAPPLWTMQRPRKA